MPVETMGSQQIISNEMGRVASDAGARQINIIHKKRKHDQFQENIKKTSGIELKTGILKSIQKEKIDQGPPAGDPNITVNEITSEKAVDSAQNGVDNNGKPPEIIKPKTGKNEDQSTQEVGEVKKHPLKEETLGPSEVSIFKEDDSLLEPVSNNQNNNKLEDSIQELKPSEENVVTPHETVARGKTFEKIKETKKPRVIGGQNHLRTAGGFKSRLEIGTDKPKKRVLTSDNVKKLGIMPPKFVVGENKFNKGVISTSDNINAGDGNSKREIKQEIIKRVRQDQDREEKRKRFLEKQEFEKLVKKNPQKVAEAIVDKSREDLSETDNRVTDTREQLLGNKEAKRPEFLTEQGEKEITEAKKSTTLRLENKLVKTGFFNKETAGDFILNVLSGKEDAWGSAKADFAEKQWSQAKEILQDKVEKAIYSIKDFDSVHKNYCKTSSEVFGKYIDNLEKAFNSSEYYNNKEMVDIQSDLGDIKGLFDINADNLAQWRGKNKGLRGLIRRFKLATARKFGDKEGKIVQSILAEDNKMRQSLENSNKDLMDKLKLLQSRINGEIEEIPEKENIVILEDKNIKENVSSTLQEGLEASEISTEVEKRMGDLYTQLINKNGSYGPEDLGKLNELRDMLNTNKDAEFDYKNKFGSTSKVKSQDAIEGINSTIKLVEESKSELKDEVRIDPLATLRKKSEKVEEADINNRDSSEDNKEISDKTTEKVSDETIKNNISSLYSEIVKKHKAKQELSGEDRNNINKINELLKNNSDINKLSVEDQSGKKYDVDVERVKKYLNSLEEKQPENKVKKSGGLFTRRSSMRPKNTVISKPASEQTVESTFEIKKLSTEKRDKLNNIFIEYAPDKTDEVKNKERLEKLMGIINNEFTSDEDKDIATLQFINYPQVGLNNLDFGNKSKEENFDHKKALQNKVNEISEKYAGGEDDLSKNIQSLVREIEDKYQFESPVRAEMLSSR